MEKKKKLTKDEKKKLEKKVEKLELENQNKQLRNIFVTIIALVVIFLLIYFGVNSLKTLKYKEVSFEIEKYCDSGPCITVHKTFLPVMFKGEVVPYNFYLRTNPDDLKEIDFNGDLIIKDLMVINMSEDFNCEGDGIIGIANLLKLYEVIGTKVIKDENASCDSDERYVYLNIEQGDETRIEQTEGTCYKIFVKDCEILKATERLMLEVFAKVNEESH